MKRRREPSRKQPRRFWLPAEVDKAFDKFAVFAGDFATYDGRIMADGTYLLSWKGAGTKGGFLIRTSDWDRYQEAVQRAHAIVTAKLRRKGVQSEGNGTKGSSSEMAV